MVRRFDGRPRRHGKAFKAEEIRGSISAKVSNHLAALNIPTEIRTTIIGKLCRRLARKSRINPGQAVSETFNLFAIIEKGVPQKEKGLIKVTFYANGKAQILRVEK